ncbi:FecR family protein [Rubritalea squalenifaciens DSM 18772]|uniref:FecR family protein n=1 Tax=Rubritalea squalenifaciens DSM 18772 TaxID=1123071 RepID=A0A1M6NV23_9BACT|nr:FecR domain-containing protein [Rubritalea squalenifaciens]SHJ99556.1 FecR family protein [Rubritalea squalenifaciens DSM 18772]
MSEDMDRDWQEWIDRIEREDVTEEELREFRAALESSPEQMEHYLEALMVESSLDLKAGLSMPAPTEAAGKVTFLQRCKLPLAVAAAVAFSVGTIMFLTNQEASVPVSGESYLATVSDSNPIADEAGLRIGAPLQAGEISLPEGARVGIAMRKGASLEVNGPARFRIDDAMRIYLYEGRVQTYAPEYAHGFTIETDEGKVIDLGTRFVTTSGTELGTEIHVNEGLVEADVNDQVTQLAEGQAGILKDGKLSSTDYLANRLNVPLDPTLKDSDGDGVSDVVERFYGNDPNDSSDHPRMLRLEESFVGYKDGEREDEPFMGTGSAERWKGRGIYLGQGLEYRNHGKQLLSKGGGFSTVGIGHIGNSLYFKEGDLPDQGVIYMSFLMKVPEVKSGHSFGGFLLYNDTYNEKLFVGDLSPVTQFGSRYEESSVQTRYPQEVDTDVHLFVIRIDRTRQVTDIFMDPPLDALEHDLKPTHRHQGSPDFDSLMLRSGGAKGYVTLFDELRVALSWGAVLPLAD